MATPNLPVVPFDLTKTIVALRNTQREAGRSMALILMDKTGQWCFGIDREPIDEEQLFLIPPASFQHGYICWASEALQKLGEHVVPLGEPLPETGPVPAGGRGWEFQLGLGLRGYEGDFAEREGVYRTGSYGGKQAVVTLAQLVAAKLTAFQQDTRRDDFVPLVTLGSDHYIHGKYGKIFTPEFNIVKWVRMPKETVEAPIGDGQPEPEQPILKALKAKKKNGKRR